MTTLITVLPLNYFMVCTLIKFKTYEPTVPTYVEVENNAILSLIYEET